MTSDELLDWVNNLPEELEEKWDDYLENAPDGLTIDEYRNGFINHMKNVIKENYNDGDKETRETIEEAAPEWFRALGSASRKDVDLQKLIDDGAVKLGQSVDDGTLLEKSIEWGMTPEDVRKTIHNAALAYSKKVQEQAPAKISDKRLYLSHMANGDDDEMQGLESKYAEDPEMQNFFNQSKKDFGWGGVKGYARSALRNAANLAGGSIVNAYMKDIATGEGDGDDGWTTTFTQYPRQLLADVGVSGAGLLTGGIGGKVAGKIITKPMSQFTLGLQKGLGSVTDAGIAAFEEGGRQVVAGEEIDPGAMLAGAGSAATSNAILDAGAGILAKSGITGTRQLGGAIRRANNADEDFSWKFDALGKKDAIDKALGTKNLKDEEAVQARKFVLSEELPSRHQEIEVAGEKLSDDKKSLRSSKSEFKKKLTKNGTLDLNLHSKNTELENEIIPEDKKLLSEKESAAKKELKKRSDEYGRVINLKNDGLTGELADEALNGTKQSDILLSRYNAVKGGYELPSTYSFAKKPRRALNSIAKPVDALAVRGVVASYNPEGYDRKKYARWAAGGATLEEKMSPAYQEWKLQLLTDGNGGFEVR